MGVNNTGLLEGVCWEGGSQQRYCFQNGGLAINPDFRICSDRMCVLSAAWRHGRRRRRLFRRWGRGGKEGRGRAWTSCKSSSRVDQARLEFVLFF